MNELFSPQQLAKLLGISKKTVYDWIFTKKIPYYKVGRLVRFNPDEICRWLQERKVEPYGKA
ncbi:MAG: helix-turn-helix domain-containing protein [Candidatus Omnitrophota bacterium]